MAVDPETAYHIRQAFVDLGLRPVGAIIEPPPLTRALIRAMCGPRSRNWIRGSWRFRNG